MQPKVAKGFDPQGNARAVEAAVTALKSLSHVGRLQILCHLLDGDLNVGALSLAVGEPQATVSQQLTKNLFLSEDRNFLRKGREAVYTYFLERELSKKRILEIYLNDMTFF